MRETFLLFKEKTIVPRPQRSLCKNSTETDRFTSSIMGHNYKITCLVAQTTAYVSSAARFDQNNWVEKQVTFAKATTVPPYRQK